MGGILPSQVRQLMYPSIFVGVIICFVILWRLGGNCPDLMRPRAKWEALRSSAYDLLLELSQAPIST